MSAHPLYSGARMAVRMARQCERSSLDYDPAWHAFMIEEAKRHRERAADYLRSLAMLRDEPELFERRAA